MIEMTNVLPIRGDKILLAMKKRGHGAGLWNGMGGKIEPGESITEAAIRETQEEVGITVIEFEKFAEITFDELHKGARDTILVHVFMATKWTGEPKETEEMKPQWFSRKDIPYTTMWPDDEFWLPQILEGKKLYGRFILDDTNIITDKHIQFTKGFTAE